MRYLRCEAGDEAYEQARLALDSVWGHPNAETNTQTCIEPAATAPRDAQSRIVLAVADEFCEYPAAAQMLDYMISTGAASDISETEYARASAGISL
jgi:hypothetical protein